MKNPSTLCFSSSTMHDEICAQSCHVLLLVKRSPGPLSAYTVLKSETRLNKSVVKVRLKGGNRERNRYSSQILVCLSLGHAAAGSQSAYLVKSQSGESTRPVGAIQGGENGRQ